ncbi:MAG: hypothetical protein K2Y21_09405 [Phycisphaerales bacterium]|nr:hypothetical protein [Phycisphaerales bacterium]
MNRRPRGWQLWRVAGCLTGMAVAASLVATTGCERAPDGKPIAVSRVLGEVGISPGQYAFPRCLDTDGRSLWVVDKLARVQRVDLKTGKGLSGWKMPDSDLGKPTGITVFDPTGRDEDELVFVADTHYHRVLVYRPGSEGSRENTPVTSFGSYGREDGQFIYPTDIAVLPDERGGIKRLYVSEYGGNDRISIWEPTPDASGGMMQFRFVRSFGVYGDEAAPGQVAFRRPQSMEIDHVRQRLVIADACNHRIGLFTLDGALLKWIGAANDGSQVAAGQNVESPLRYPYGLTLLDDGTALVAEFGGARVSRVDLDKGTVVATYGKPGRGDGELTTPWAVAVTGEDAFVLDSGNNRIVAFAAPAPRKEVAGLAGAGTPRLAHGGVGTSGSAPATVDVEPANAPRREEAPR